MRKALAQFCLAAAIPLHASATVPPSVPPSAAPDAQRAFQAVAIITPDQVTLSPTALGMNAIVEGRKSTIALTMFGSVIRMTSSCDDVVSINNDLSNPQTRTTIQQQILETASAFFSKISEITPLPITTQGEVSELDAHVRFTAAVIMRTAALHQAGIQASAAVCSLPSPAHAPI